MTIKRILFCLLGAIFVFGVIGCRREKTKDDGGSLRIGIFHKPTEINPFTTDSSISANLLVLLFDRLVNPTSEGGIKPELAESWEASSDRLDWTLHLRRNVHFHDGTPLTAEDVQFSLDGILKTKSGRYPGSMKYVKEVRILDPQTIQIHLSEPDNGFLAGLGVFGIAPKHVMEKDPGFVQFNKHPIGSGPYRFIKQNEDEIVLAANQGHFSGRPHLDQIIVKVLPSEAANLSHLVAGKIDMVFLLNPEDYGALAGIPTIRIYNNWYPILHMLTFNLKNGLFAHSETRRALNLAIDKQLLVERVLKGQGEIASNTIISSQGDFKIAPYPYRPDLALQILQGEGWHPAGQDYILEKGGKRFEFSALTIDGHEMNSKSLQIIQEQLRQIGIKMTIESVPFDVYVKRIFRNKDYESNFVYMIFRPFFDFNFSFWHSTQIKDGTNFTSYTNPEVDRFLEEARLGLDPEKQKAAYQKFQQVLHEDPPGIFLFWRKMPIAVHRRFHGIPESQMEDLRDLVNVWVSKEDQKTGF